MIICCRFDRWNIYLPEMDKLWDHSDGFRLSRAIDEWDMRDLIKHNRIPDGYMRAQRAVQKGTDIGVGFHALFGEKHDEYVARYL